MKAQPISLALQGGGAHGAFTWGVLDYLLEEGSLDLKAITATSAGAMNAVALAAGYAEGGHDGARELLEAFWRDVSERGAPLAAANTFTPAFGPFTPFAMFQAITNLASPYDLNPFDYNPLQQTLRKLIDFDRLRAETDIDLFIAATNVESGKVKIFKTPEITEESVLASACLPQVFKAINIDDTPLWDGGYVGNPALFPLFYADVPRDILIVHINPMTRKGTPKTAAAILDRLNEITFNASLVSELRSIAFVQKLLDENWMADRVRSRYRRMFVHAIRADKQLSKLSIETKYDTSWRFLTDLRDRGRDAAQSWILASRDQVGKTSSVDIQEEFLESFS
ncbi:patatin-like phospholipase family protein [Ponticaulis sp.]|uniref:patatin-like phospholipase family protein n=1 Tax=Ponticaulis sp. TaxID=2020902 RepID=UPI000B634C40|nr:patatin-like phospholipase family protein [Ponticaulis sp.]MAI89495.1 alpha/beta hydrolase [Ponticaulis sp.]OUY00531.1 MAG: alpha/beta hydrolase [Hyphomonadaceae bacterium TMED5]|tara:strand:+ start:152585 stop:153601 length:1017 start_codon:yes stop_codon:yes gene_type:complete